VPKVNLYDRNLQRSRLTRGVIEKMTNEREAPSPAETERESEERNNDFLDDISVASYTSLDHARATSHGTFLAGFQDGVGY
jgi:hypothetical protein